MKKIFPLLCAATIVSAPFSVYAAEDTTPVEDTLTIEVESEETINEEEIPADGTPIEEPAEIELVEKLTLEDVIKRGTENNKNLTVLQLNLEVAENQLLDTAFDKKDIARDVKKLENKLDDLKDTRKNLEDTASKIMNGQERIGVMDTLDALDDQVQALELAIQQLESGQIQLKLQGEELITGVSLLLTSDYANILLLQNQLDFTNKTIESATTEVKKVQRLSDLGMGSREAVRLAQVAETNVKKQVEELEKDYNQAVANLSFDIGIPYNPTIEIEPVVYTAALSEQPEDITTLIDNAYRVKNAQQSLATAIITRADVYREYEEDDNVGSDVTTYELKQNDLKVTAAEETVILTKEQVETALDQLYYNEETTYFAYEEALRMAEDTKLDLHALQVRYNVGIISKHAYESALIKLEQANFNVYIASMQNYLVNQSIEAAKLGYIQ